MHDSETSNVERRTPNSERGTRAGVSVRSSKFNVHCSAFPSSSRAFTLVELMVVVALIAIMTAMISPEMRGTYEDALLRSTSRELIEAFNLAHSRAVSFNRPHAVRIQPTTGEYRIEKRVRLQGEEEFVPLRDVIGSEGKLDSRIKVEFRLPPELSADESAAPEPPPDALDPSITFFPDGTADAKEVLLEDRQGFRLLLRMNPTTSRVRILDVPRS
jgi:type II secretion system protein H